jgi:hypothetical protein
VTDRGSEIELRARVRSDDVAHGLEQLRPDQQGRGGEARFTWQGRSKYVRLRALETTTTSARSRTMQLGFAVTGETRDSILDVSVGGFGPDDLTEAAVRTAVFGERNPLSRQRMDFVTELPDPWLPLRDHPVPEESLRPIAELLLTDVLVGSGRAARIVAFKLGVAVHGKRKCVVAWQTPRRYSNASETIRSVEGFITL